MWKACDGVFFFFPPKWYSISDIYKYLTVRHLFVNFGMKFIVTFFLTQLYIIKKYYNVIVKTQWFFISELRVSCLFRTISLARNLCRYDCPKRAWHSLLLDKESLSFLWQLHYNSVFLQLAVIEHRILKRKRLQTNLKRIIIMTNLNSFFPLVFNFFRCISFQSIVWSHATVSVTFTSSHIDWYLLLIIGNNTTAVLSKFNINFFLIHRWSFFYLYFFQVLFDVIYIF